MKPDPRIRAGERKAIQKLLDLHGGSYARVSNKTGLPVGMLKAIMDTDEAVGTGLLDVLAEELEVSPDDLANSRFKTAAEEKAERDAAKRPKPPGR